MRLLLLAATLACVPATRRPEATPVHESRELLRQACASYVGRDQSALFEALGPPSSDYAAVGGAHWLTWASAPVAVSHGSAHTLGRQATYSSSSATVLQCRISFEIDERETVIGYSLAGC